MSKNGILAILMVILLFLGYTILTNLTKEEETFSYKKEISTQIFGKELFDQINPKITAEDFHELLMRSTYSTDINSDRLSTQLEVNIPNGKIITYFTSKIYTQNNNRLIPSTESIVTKVELFHNNELVEVKQKT